MNRSIFLFLNLIFELLKSQSIAYHLFDHRSNLILNDAGHGWSTLSNISNKRYTDQNSYLNESFSSSSKSSIILDLVPSPNFYTFNFFRFNKIYCFYMAKINHKNTKILSVEESGFGFKNNWVNISINRGRESWGSSEKISLALSDFSKPYDFLTLSSDYGNVRVNYIHGFLETIGDNNNRYITARGLEWTNKRSLIISMSETVIYSGQNRSFDISYFNPIASHLELELNDRLNVIDTKNSNGVWQMHIDWMIRKGSRLSFNLLIDEFVLDPLKELNKENGIAHSMKISQSIISNKNHILNLKAYRITVGTPTLRHVLGSNNFVNKNSPLGWREGSDGIESTIEINYLFLDKITLEISQSNILIGESSILNNSYTENSDFSKKSFPSGEIERKKNLRAAIIWKIKPKVHFLYKLFIQNSSKNKYIVEPLLGIRAVF